jgi:hypothetical protein
LEKLVNTRAPSRRYDSVQQDWRAFLPDAKASLFLRHTRALENDYLIFSISLNEALDLYREGKLLDSSRETDVLAALCARLAIRINAVLHGMWQHGRHFGIVPNLAPLEVSNFRSERGQRGARYNYLLNHILLSERSQFLNKLSTLEEIVDALGDEFIGSANRLAFSAIIRPSLLVQSLDFAHFDLNTCVRETDVLLKSFLFVLPEDQLDNFDFTVCGLARARRPMPVSDLDLIRSRRIAAVAGE